jgi:hypothetical protein
VRQNGRTLLPSDSYRSFRPRPDGRGGNRRPSARRRKTAYVSSQGLPTWARHQSSAKQGYADSATTTAVASPHPSPSMGVGGVSDLALALAVSEAGGEKRQDAQKERPVLPVPLARSL